MTSVWLPSDGLSGVAAVLEEIEQAFLVHQALAKARSLSWYCVVRLRFG
jgi:hypothetical protein